MMEKLFTFHRISLEVIALRTARIALIILLTMLAQRFIKMAVRRLLKLRVGGGQDLTIHTHKRAETLAQIVQSTSWIVLVVIAGMLVAEQVGISLGPLLAGAGIVGLAVGFGAQTLVKDVITGFFILLENQFGLGDLIEIDGAVGVVEEMNLRTTTLRDLQGRAHIIPNGTIQKVTLMSRGWSRAVIDIAVGYQEDLDRVMAIMQEEAQKLAENWPDRLIDKPQTLGVEKLGENALTVRLIAKTAPGEQEEVSRELRRRLAVRFSRERIEMASPQTIWLERQHRTFGKEDSES